MLDTSGISVAPPKCLWSTTTTTLPLQPNITSSQARRSDTKPMTTKAETTPTNEDDNSKNEDDSKNEEDSEDEEDLEDEDEDSKDSKDEDDSTSISTHTGTNNVNTHIATANTNTAITHVANANTTDIAENVVDDLGLIL